MNRTRIARLGGVAILAAGVAFSMALPASASTETADTTYSVAALDSAKTTLDQRSATRPADVTGWGVDQATNAVVVRTTGSKSAAAKWANSGTVRVERVAEAPEPMWSLIGGQAITSGSRCSLGFNATLGSSRYVITAGHCTNIGGTWSGVGGTIGPVAGSSFPTNDYGAIRVSSSSATSTGLVDRYSAGSDVRVVGSNQAGVGARVCRSGSTTGWHCGTILGLNETVCYSQGCVYQTIRTNVCAEPGDSGGSLVTAPNSSGQVHAQGLTSGGSGNCRTGGITYYQPINEVLSTWGLRLVTG